MNRDFVKLYKYERDGLYGWRVIDSHGAVIKYAHFNTPEKRDEYVRIVTQYLRKACQRGEIDTKTFAGASKPMLVAALWFIAMNAPLDGDEQEAAAEALAGLDADNQLDRLDHVIYEWDHLPSPEQMIQDLLDNGYTPEDIFDLLNPDPNGE